MNADEKRKVFEELLDDYQDVILSEFSYEDGEREAERRAWLNKYDGIQEPLIKDEKIREVVRVWAEANNVDKVEYSTYPTGDCSFIFTYDDGEELLLDFRYKIDNLTPCKTYTIAELCGEEEE